MPQDVFSGLTNLNGLSLFGNDQLSTLPRGVFSGLPRLGSLTLFDCGFVRLPEGIFTGLSRVGTLWLHGNPGSPFTLTVELVRKDNKDRTAPGPANVVIKVAEGAPREMTVSLSARGGTLSADKATIAVGATESETVVVTQTEGGPVIVIPGSASALPTRFLGLKDRRGRFPRAVSIGVESVSRVLKVRRKSVANGCPPRSTWVREGFGRPDVKGTGAGWMRLGVIATGCNVCGNC